MGRFVELLKRGIVQVDPIYAKTDILHTLRNHDGQYLQPASVFIPCCNGWVFIVLFLYTFVPPHCTNVCFSIQNTIPTIEVISLLFFFFFFSICIGQEMVTTSGDSPLLSHCGYFPSLPVPVTLNVSDYNRGVTGTGCEVK